MSLEEYGFREKSDWEILSNGTHIHRTALISPWVRFGNNCIVNPFSIVGKIPDKSKTLARNPTSVNSNRIGANTIIGCNVIIFSDVILGEDCYVGDYASIREGSRIGSKCIIGRQVTLHYNVIIGNESKFMDGTHITGDCNIGDGCFFGVGVVTSNDRNVNMEEYKFSGSEAPKFGNKILVGSGANILAGVKIADNAIIGAGALVVKDVDEGEKILSLRAKPGGYLRDFNHECLS